MSETPEQVQAPGCGLAVYTLLLAALGLAGVAGVLFSSLALLQGDGSNPGELTSGTNVEAFRLAPLVKAGVLPPGEVPAAWHDESALGDGGRACALTREAVIRVEDGQGSRVPFAEVQDVAIEDLPDKTQVVTVTGANGKLSCLFGQGEGALRLVRQIQTEVARIHPPAG